MVLDVVRVPRAGRLRGRLRVPPDKSISHRALLLAAVAEGTSRILDGSDALDPNSTAACLRALGVDVERGAGDGVRVDRTVRSPGWRGWRPPAGPLDCGNSGTTMRLLAGLLAGSPVAAELDGDASLRRRPMARIIEPLRAMGAAIRTASGDTFPPLVVAGRRPLRSVSWTSPVASAQVKSTILLAGLAAEGTTLVREPAVTRDHTERMLRARGLNVASGRAANDGGWWVSVEGGRDVAPLDERIPADISAAAFWLVAGSVHPDAELSLEAVGVNPTRRAVIDILRNMGAEIEERPLPGAPDTEPVADLSVRSSRLEAVEVGPDEVARAIDEVPILCLAAACARGTTRIRGAGELRHKESDRLAGIVAGLTALGARMELVGDDVTIHGGAGRAAFGLRGTVIHSLNDHRLAMAFAIAGLVANDVTTVEGAGAAAVSDPGFFTDLERVRA